MTPATTHRFICGGNVTDPVDDLLACQAAIRSAGWWNRANLQEHWPLTTEAAAELLASGGEFEIDADGLADLIERRLLPCPATLANRNGARLTSSKRVVAWKADSSGVRHRQHTIRRNTPAKSSSKKLGRTAKSN